jgi:hypothetical protein
MANLIFSLVPSLFQKYNFHAPLQKLWLFFNWIKIFAEFLRALAAFFLSFPLLFLVAYNFTPLLEAFNGPAQNLFT